MSELATNPEIREEISKLKHELADLLLDEIEQRGWGVHFTIKQLHCSSRTLTALRHNELGPIKIDWILTALLRLKVPVKLFSPEEE